MNSDESSAMAETSIATSSSTDSKPSVDTVGCAGTFHPLPFLFKDAGPGMVAETGSGTIYAYKRVELEVDLTEPLHNLLDDLLPYSPTDLEDVILLMCGRKQLSLSTTFQDFTYQGIHGSRAKVKLDLLWNPHLEPNTRAGGRLTGGQTIINIDDLYRIVDEADPLYWLNTANNSQSAGTLGATTTTSGRSTNSTTLLDSQYSQAGLREQQQLHAADNKTPAVTINTAHLPPLSPPSSGAHVISPPSNELSAEDAMMLDEMEAERNNLQNACDVVQQRDLVVSVAAGNVGSGGGGGAADTDASTSALTPASGGTGSVGEGGRRSRGSHRSGASLCGSLPSCTTGNALQPLFTDSAALNVHTSQHLTSNLEVSNSIGIENNTVDAVASTSSRKRRRKPTLHASPALPPTESLLLNAVKTENFEEASMLVSIAASSAFNEKPTPARRRVTTKRPRRSGPPSTKQFESLTMSPPFIKVKSASPTADYLMSVSRMFSGEEDGMHHAAVISSGPSSSSSHNHQLFQFPSPLLLSPRGACNDIVVEPREVHTTASSLSSPEEDLASNMNSNNLSTMPESAAGDGDFVPKVTKKRRPNKKPRRPVAVSSSDVKIEPDCMPILNAAIPLNSGDPDSTSAAIILPTGLKKKRTIGANSYYAYNLGQTFDAVGKNIQLWQYLLELLMDPTRYQRSIEWMDGTGTFTLKEPERVAFLWGERKGSKKRKSESMSYENMSRALRYYYGEILDKVPSKQFTYRFINLKERIGHDPDELFGFARGRALAVGLQLPSVSNSTPASLAEQHQQLPASNRSSSSPVEQQFTFSVDGSDLVNSVAREVNPTQQQLSAEADKQHNNNSTAGIEINGRIHEKKSKSAKRSNKRKKSARSNVAEDVQQQQQSSSGDMTVETTPEPALSLPTAQISRQNSYSKPSSAAISTAAATPNHFSSSPFVVPTSNSNGNTMQASHNVHAHFPQLPILQQQQQNRCSPAAVVEMVRNNGNGNGLAFNPQNLNFLLHQLAANGHNNNTTSNNGSFQTSSAPTSHFGLAPPALEDALLQQQHASRNLSSFPPPSQQVNLNGNNNNSQLMPQQAQMLAQLLQQQQQQQHFIQQQRQNNSVLLNSNNNNNSCGNGSTQNCITLPGVGTINLASFVPQQQQQQHIVPQNNNNSLNNALITAVLAASSGGGNTGGGGLNIADGMRNLLAKVAEGGSQVNQLMAAVGLATLLSSAQQQQSALQQQQQAPPPLPQPAQPSNMNNCIAQVFALLQQQQQSQQLQLQNSVVAATSSSASGAATIASASAPFSGVFGLRF